MPIYDNYSDTQLTTNVQNLQHNVITREEIHRLPTAHLSMLGT